MTEATCNKQGGHYRNEDHDCYCVVPRAEKHSVHQCWCKAGWIERGKRNG